MSDSSRPHGLQPTRLLHPWDFPDKSTGIGVSLTDLPIHHVVNQVSILVTDNDRHLGVVHNLLYFKDPVMSHAGQGSAMSNRACLGQNKDADRGIFKGSGHSSCPATPPLSPAPAIPSDMLMSLHPPWSSASEAFCIGLGRVFLTASDFCLACVCWVVPCHCLECQNGSLCGTLCL